MKRQLILIDAGTVQSAQHFLNRLPHKAGDSEMSDFLHLDGKLPQHVQLSFLKRIRADARASPSSVFHNNFCGAKTLPELLRGLDNYCGVIPAR